MTTPSPPSTSNKKRPGRLWAAVMLPVVLLVLLIGWQEWRGWPWLRQPLADRLSAQLHHEVFFGQGFALRVLGKLRLQVDSLKVAQPAWYLAEAGGKDGKDAKVGKTADAISPNMLEADGLKLVVPYSTLFKALVARRVDDVRIEEISVARIDGQLMRDKTGRANWSLDPSGKAPVTSPDKGPATLPHVQKLIVHEGRLNVVDEPLELDLKVNASTFEGEDGGAGLRVTGDGRYKRNPFEVEIKSSGVLPLVTLPDKAPPVPIVIRAEAGPSRLNFDGHSRDLLKLGDLEGTLNLRGPSLAAIGDAVGVTLPTTARFALNGQLRKDGDLWGLKVDKLNVGDSRLAGDFTFDRRLAVPLLKGELSGSNLALADLAPAFGAAAPGAGNPKPPSGRVLPQKEFDVPSLRAMNAQVALRLDQASLGALFAQPLRPLQADLALRDGVLTLSNIVARTAGGNLGGMVKLDGNGKTLLWDANLDWSGIKLEYWLNVPEQAKLAAAEADRAAKEGRDDKRGLAPPPPPVDTQASAQGGKPKRSYVSGELAGNADLKGEGNSTAQLLASIDGHATSWVRDGRLSKLLVEAASLHLPEALGLWLTGDEQQPMQCAATRVLARNGQLIPEVAIVDTPSATILASGQVSLADEKLDLTVVSHPKTMSPVSLRTPIDVRGSFTDPSIRLHPNPLGLKVVGAVALGAVAPLAAILPLIDVDKQKEGGCARALELLQRQPPPVTRRAGSDARG